MILIITHHCQFQQNWAMQGWVIDDSIPAHYSRQDHSPFSSERSGWNYIKFGEDKGQSSELPMHIKGNWGGKSRPNFKFFHTPPPTNSTGVMGKMSQWTEHVQSRIQTSDILLMGCCCMDCEVECMLVKRTAVKQRTSSQPSGSLKSFCEHNSHNGK